MNKYNIVIVKVQVTIDFFPVASFIHKTKQAFLKMFHFKKVPLKLYFRTLSNTKK